MMYLYSCININAVIHNTEYIMVYYLHNNYLQSHLYISYCYHWRTPVKVAKRIFPPPPPLHDHDGGGSKRISIQKRALTTPQLVTTGCGGRPSRVVVQGNTSISSSITTYGSPDVPIKRLLTKTQNCLFGKIVFYTSTIVSRYIVG